MPRARCHLTVSGPRSPPRLVTAALVKLWSLRPWQSDYTRGAAQLASSVLAAQIIALAGGTLLARLYFPASQDLVTSFIWIINSVMPLITLRYDVGIVMPKSESCASQLFRLSILCALVVPMAAVPVVLACGWLGWGKWASLLWIPPTLLGLGLTNTFIGWCNRRRFFGMQSTSKIILAAVYPILATTAWLFNGEVPGHLTASFCLATLCGAATFALLLHRTGTVPRLSWSRTRWRNLWHTARSFLRLPLFSVPSYFLNMASLAVLVTSLQVFSAGTSSSFNLVFQVMRVPAVLLGLAVGQAFTSKSATLVDNLGKLRLLTLGTMGALSLIALPFAATFTWAGPTLFAWVYGEPWREAGEFSRWLAWGAAAGLIATPLSMLPILLRANFIQLLLTFIIAVARCAVAWMAHQGASAWTVVIGSTVIDLCAAALFLLLVLWLLRSRRSPRPSAPVASPA